MVFNNISCLGYVFFYLLGLYDHRFCFRVLIRMIMYVILLDDAGKSVQVSLDESSGSGFISEDMHLSSYFSA